MLSTVEQGQHARSRHLTDPNAVLPIVGSAGRFEQLRDLLSNLHVHRCLTLECLDLTPEGSQGLPKQLFDPQWTEQEPTVQIAQTGNYRPAKDAGSTGSRHTAAQTHLWMVLPHTKPVD